MTLGEVFTAMVPDRYILCRRARDDIPVINAQSVKVNDILFFNFIITMLAVISHNSWPMLHHVDIKNSQIFDVITMN
jgi:hypothetical protein